MVFILHIRNRSMEKAKLLVQDHRSGRAGVLTEGVSLGSQGSMRWSCHPTSYRAFHFPVSSVVLCPFLMSGFVLVPLEGPISLFLPGSTLLYSRWTYQVVGASFCSSQMTLFGDLAHMHPLTVLPFLLLFLPSLPSLFPFLVSSMCWCMCLYSCLWEARV